MAHRWKNDLTQADVTPFDAFMNRRQLMGGALGLGLIGAAGVARAQDADATADTSAVDYSGSDLTPNAYEDITEYNNFYEFGTGKADPARNAGDFVTKPWTVAIEGMVDNPGDFSMEQILEAMTIEKRIYRFRCVEAWSMVVPWNGFELADLLNMAGVQEGAKYVAFETALKPDEMPGVRFPVLDWPYVEGLRLDEAMHPLTLMATGIYDKPIPNQNGAPIRLVVPWKYGFKSIKSIVKITVTDKEPPTSWHKSNPGEYGFYSNVNPNVDHPRWSQATERAVGGGLFASRQDTLMFNGYEDEVASLYEGMDLKANF